MNVQKISAAAIITTMLLSSSFAQGLFESAGTDSSNAGLSTQPAPQFTMSGNIKGSMYGGRNNVDDPAISGTNARLSLIFDEEKSDLGKAFAEVRVAAGKNRDSASFGADLREAWVAISPGPVVIKLGSQIIAWGRADGINPTNNITPRDETVLSSEFDDSRLSNELLQIKVKAGQSSIQGIWVPLYRPDVLPLSGEMLPAEITISNPDYPDRKLDNGGYALRYDYTLPTVDGAISYFNGYATLPAFNSTLGQTGLTLIPTAYRMHAAGADFSTSIGSLGLRGEIAAKIPVEDYNHSVYLPHPYLQYVIGMDKSLSDWNTIIQYSGVYVHGFKKIEYPSFPTSADPTEQMLYGAALAKAETNRLNRLFSRTSDEFSHSVTGQIQYTILHETMLMRVTGLYNFTTEEYVLNPNMSYDIADGINLTLGGRYFSGPDGSLNSMISDLMTNAYIELKVSF